MSFIKLSRKYLVVIAVLFAATSAYSAIGFLKGEQVSGMNKICYYDVLGSTQAINVASYSVCPSTYNF